MTPIARIEHAIDRIETALAVTGSYWDENTMPDDGYCLDPEFIDRSVALAADLALIFVGASHDQMLQHLVTVRERMKMRLAGSLGVEVAAFVAESFVATVARCKNEIEKATVANSGTIQ